MSGFMNAPERGGNVDWVTLDEGMYEAHITDVDGNVKNPFYDPINDNPAKKYQYKWTIEIDTSSMPELEEGKRYSNRVTYFTGKQMGWHPKNKLVGLLRKLLKDFVYDAEGNGGKGIMTSFADEDAFKTAVIGNPIRVIIEHNPGTGDKAGNIYYKATALMGSNAAPMSVADLMAKNLGGETTFEDDLPWGK